MPAWHGIIALPLALLAGGIAGAAARADDARAPARAGDAKIGPVLPFVGGNGLGLAKLTRSDIEAALGSPEEVAVVGKAGDRGDGPRPLELRYPSLGLGFSVDASHAHEANPPLSQATVEAPSDRRTPHGLHLGMPQDEAMPIIESVYRVSARTPMSWGHGGQGKGETVLARNPGWRASQRARFDFRENRLYRMSFQLRPNPLVRFEHVRSLFNTLLAFVIVTLLANAATALKRRMGPWWERARLALSGIMVVSGLAGIALGVASFGDWNPYSRMAGLLMALYSVGLVFLALRLLSNSSNASVSRTAGVILLTVVALAMAAKFA